MFICEFIIIGQTSGWNNIARAIFFFVKCVCERSFSTNTCCTRMIIWHFCELFFLYLVLYNIKHWGLRLVNDSSVEIIVKGVDHPRIRVSQLSTIVMHGLLVNVVQTFVLAVKLHTVFIIVNFVTFFSMQFVFWYCCRIRGVESWLLKP